MGGKSSTSTTIQKVPEWVEEGGKFLISEGRELADRPFEAYTGDRVADLTADQSSAFGMIRNLVNNAPNVTPAATSLVASGAAAPTQSIMPAERVVDENGRLGSINDYMNPYIQNAVDPAVRRILENADQQQKKIGAMATSSGAFGDARHGILDAALGRDTNLAIGETTGKMYSDAFNTAMGNRTADLNRFIDVDKTNANLAETGANRNIAGGKALVDTSNAGNQGALETIRSLLASGTAQQAQTQAGLDADFSEFLRKYGDDFAKLQALGTALNSAPYTKESTTTSTQPGGGMGWAGSLAGGLLGMI